MFKYLLPAVCLSFSLGANAAILDLGTITRDTATGLDWLDVTQTRGVSYDDVIAQMGVGGAYEGWRYAMPAELDQLIVNFGFVGASGGCSYGAAHCSDEITQESTVVRNIIRTLGDTYGAYVDATNDFFDVDPNGAGYVQGILGSNLINPAFPYHDEAYIATTDLLIRSTGAQYGSGWVRVKTVWGSGPDSSTSPSAGSFLVAPSVVPLPGAAWLFIAAIAGLAGQKKLSGKSNRK